MVIKRSLKCNRKEQNGTESLQKNTIVIFIKNGPNGIQETIKSYNCNKNEEIVSGYNENYYLTRSIVENQQINKTKELNKAGQRKDTSVKVYRKGSINSLHIHRKNRTVGREVLPGNRNKSVRYRRLRIHK